MTPTDFPESCPDWTKRPENEMDGGEKVKVGRRRHARCARKTQCREFDGAEFLSEEEGERGTSAMRRLAPK